MKKVLVYLRYILPAVFVILTVVAAFIPNVSFTLEMNELEVRSLAAVVSDAWQQCREYITDIMVTKDESTTAFVTWTMAGMIVAALIAAASVGLSVWSAVLAIRTVKSSDGDTTKADQARSLLCRVFPGKLWMLAANWLIIIPAMFPHYLAMVYTNVLYLTTSAKSGLTWIAFMLAAVSGVLVFVTRDIEKDLNMDAFAVRAKESK
ncbi:MAG: hypothetical protein IJY27_07230 [Clostridia bacterium]|nr:hypothetical protein [Clostridia bacterium]